MREGRKKSGARGRAEEVGRKRSGATSRSCSARATTVRLRAGWVVSSAGR
ncbi:hypothetical protein ACFPM0_20310 [Pseudonocardia sulfidoxydans]